MRDYFESFLVTNQTDIHTVLFFIGISVVALWEVFSPRRKLTASMTLRWIGNLSCMLINGALLWFIFSGWGVESSITASEFQWGLLRQLDIPHWFAFMIGILLMDLGHYCIHFLFHRIPILWRLHRLHHTDQDFDFTTGLRFHPGEAIIEHGANLAVIALVGPPFFAVILFVFSYVITTNWVHGNICMPANWDRRMRWLIITPEMHRTHHSQIPNETNSNYGGLFSFWDRIFGHYVDEPDLGHEGMAIGLRGFSNEQHIRLPWMMVNPFLNVPDNNNITDMDTSNALESLDNPVEQGK